jgi:hypothetical protein
MLLSEINDPPKTIKDAAEYASRIIKNSREVSRGAMFEPPEGNDDQYTFSIRNWGKWEMPDGEEDDGDYDWEVLSDASAKKMKEYLDMCATHYPFKYTFRTQEKNWIDVIVSKK